jgi:hypothetical protein
MITRGGLSTAGTRGKAVEVEFDAVLDDERGDGGAVTDRPPCRSKGESRSEYSAKPPGSPVGKP